MKYARTYGNTVIYYAKPEPTEQKRNRWPVKVGERTCSNRLCAWLRKVIYGAI